MKMTNNYEKALKYAIKAYDGLYDKTGNVYVIHLLDIANLLETDIDKATALLHNVVEKTCYTLRDIENWGFDNPIISAIEILIRKDNENYEDYINRILKSESVVATRVVLAKMKYKLRNKKLTTKKMLCYQKWISTFEERLINFPNIISSKHFCPELTHEEYKAFVKKSRERDLF